MALASVLSEKGLARFRTKRCERLLATGSCAFGEKCQYSHDKCWCRRNPVKIQYKAELCPKVAASGNAAACEARGDCPFAHTMEEVQYHPQRYKTSLCQHAGPCTDYYCPFAHSRSELRVPPPPLPEYPPTTPSSKASETPSSKASETPSWCEIDERLCIETDVMGLDADSANEALQGCRIVAGLLREKNGSSQPCRVRLISAGRSEREEATSVVRDIRKWMSSEAKSSPRFLDLRRTVATICLALPEDRPLRPLGTCKPLFADWRSESKSAALIIANSSLRSLVRELQQLHSLEVSHLCITPGSVFVESAADASDGMIALRLGDFLGKIRTLLNLNRGQAHPKETKLVEEFNSWAMWQPPEFHQQVKVVHQKRGMMTGAAPDHGLNFFKADAWQLGVLICYFLTGRHPFGPIDQPTEVCTNIVSGVSPDLCQLKATTPMFADLVGRLIQSPAEARLSISEILGHPALWSFDQSADYASRCLAQRSAFDSTQRLPCAPPPGLPLPTTSSKTVMSVWPKDSIRPLLDMDLTDLSQFPVTAPLATPSASQNILNVFLGKADREKSLMQTPRSSASTASSCRNIDEVRSGSVIRCSWQGGVRFRRSRRRSDTGDARVEHGEEVKVLERHGDWVRCSAGWLPLHGVKDAHGVPLFQVSGFDAEEPTCTTPAAQRRAPKDLTPTPPSQKRVFEPGQALAAAEQLDLVVKPPGLHHQQSSQSNPEPEAEPAEAEDSLLRAKSADKELLLKNLELDRELLLKNLELELAMQQGPSQLLQQVAQQLNPSNLTTESAWNSTVSVSTAEVVAGTGEPGLWENLEADAALQSYDFQAHMAELAFSAGFRAAAAANGHLEGPSAASAAHCSYDFENLQGDYAGAQQHWEDLHQWQNYQEWQDYQQWYPQDYVSSSPSHEHLWQNSLQSPLPAPVSPNHVVRLELEQALQLPAPRLSTPPPPAHSPALAAKDLPVKLDMIDDFSDTCIRRSLPASSTEPYVPAKVEVTFQGSEGQDSFDGRSRHDDNSDSLFACPPISTLLQGASFKPSPVKIQTKSEASPKEVKGFGLWI
eukprot:TRINITY_DN11502_c0_g1_i1.p1 TRINITY_DN11502_c0_g1~~TRINITY_DN11502_c0_g1_i1.p1  ORF type:complete len:1114 (-),score=259.83 TRINITY_DN11502_c0_g1_i1:87-3260(-)